MKKLLVILLGLAGTFSLSLIALAPSSATSGTLRTPEELDEIFAPIALYPDALVALILPASTVPADIARATDFLAANGDPGQIASQPWNESVQSLAHYPDVVKWMNDNLPWTQEAGDAFLMQPADVMKSIQQLRARAVAAGSLVSTPQQQVITDGNDIRIVPAQPDVIYVPRYDPDVVYEEQPSFNGPWMTFGVGYPEGIWLNYDLNWDDYGIWIGQWHPGWDYRRPPWRHAVGVVPPGGHAWRPPPGRRPARPFDGNRGPHEIVHPNPFPGAPVRPVRQAQARGPAPAPVLHASTAPAFARPDLRGYPPATQGRPVVATPTPAPAQTGRERERPAVATPAPAPTPAPATSHVFGGYDRGSDARAASQRGQMSRQPAPAPTRMQPPASFPRPAAPAAPPPQRSAPSGPPAGGQGNPERKRQP